MTEYLQVFTTLPNEEAAQRLARELVERRLAGCVQVLGPIRSTYHWEGAIEESQEWLCVAKTRLDCYPLLERAILELHSYEVPEILALPVYAGNPAYLSWLKGELERT